MLPAEITQAGANDALVDASADQTSLGRDDFLRMLVAQLEHQDPLNPQEATEFTAQLAQFSSLEQLLTMRQSLDAVVEAQTGLAGTIESLAAGGLVGRKVVASGEHFEMGSGGAIVSQPAFRLAGDSSSTTVRVGDGRGAVLRVLELGALGRGVHSVDPEQLEDADLPRGVYSFEVLASGGSEPVAVERLLVGTVHGAVPGPEPLLRLGELEVPYAQILEIGDAAGKRP